MDFTVFSLVNLLQNLDTNYSFHYLLSLIMCEKVGKKKLLGRSALCIKISSDQITFLIKMLIFSSPEQEVLMVSYCNQSLSVVRRLCIVNFLL